MKKERTRPAAEVFIERFALTIITCCLVAGVIGFISMLNKQQTFTTQAEAETTYVTPTLWCIGASCLTTPSPTQTQASPNPTSPQSTPIVNDPCITGTESEMVTTSHQGHGRDNHGFIDKFLQLIDKFIKLIQQTLGMLPTSQPTSGPTIQPVTPTTSPCKPTPTTFQTTPTPAPTSIPQPTSTIAPTSTLTPTVTLQLTSTPTATASPTNTPSPTQTQASPNPTSPQSTPIVNDPCITGTESEMVTTSHQGHGRDNHGFIDKFLQLIDKFIELIQQTLGMLPTSQPTSGPTIQPVTPTTSPCKPTPTTFQTTPTPAPTSIPQPTSTIAPTSTLTPTVTLQLTSTPTATASPTNTPSPTQTQASPNPTSPQSTPIVIPCISGMPDINQENLDNQGVIDKLLQLIDQAIKLIQQLLGMNISPAITISPCEPVTTPKIIQKNYKFDESPSSKVKFQENVTAGNLLLVGVTQWVGTVSSVTDNRGNTYTLVGAKNAVSEKEQDHVQLYYAKNAIGGATTVTVNFTEWTDHTIGVYEYQGLSKVSPLDKVVSQTGRSTNPDGGVLTGSVDNELYFVVGVDDWSNNSQPKAGSGYTLGNVQTDSAKNERYYSEHRISPKGSYQTNFSIDTSSYWAVVGATFK